MLDLSQNACDGNKVKRAAFTNLHYLWKGEQCATKLRAAKYTV